MTWLSSLQLSFDNPIYLQQQTTLDINSDINDINKDITDSKSTLSTDKSAKPIEPVKPVPVSAKNTRTRLFHRLHTGALMIQRPLYPEPDNQQGICHIYVLYPPAGIADGDSLTLTFTLQAHSHAVITTPGAGKWYGHRAQSAQNTNNDSIAIQPSDSSLGVQKVLSVQKTRANQTISASIDDGAILEWLPQESIYYDHSFSEALNRFELADNASLLTWDIAVFGRQAFDETFDTGHYGNRLQIWRGEQLLVSEHTNQPASSRWFASKLGMNNQHVHGSFWAVPSLAMVDRFAVQQAMNNETTLKQATFDTSVKRERFLDHAITELRQLIDEHHLPIACTHNYQALNCRYLGADVQACFEAFYQLRELLRALWYDLMPHRPRIWDT